MRIQLKGRGGATADEELLSRVEKKLGKVARQVSPLAELTIEIREERGEQVAEGALRLKGVTLRRRTARPRSNRPSKSARGLLVPCYR